MDVGKASASGSSRWTLEGPDGPGLMPCIGAPPARGTRQDADSVASAHGHLQASPGRPCLGSVPAGSGPLPLLCDVWALTSSLKPLGGVPRTAVL